MAVIYRTALTLWVTRLGCCELYEVISEIQRKSHLFPSNFYEEKKRITNQREPSRLSVFLLVEQNHILYQDFAIEVATTIKIVFCKMKCFSLSPYLNLCIINF